MTNRANQNWPVDEVVSVPVTRTKTYSVWYRTGGTLNFKWQLVGTIFADVDAARTRVAELRTMGYPAHFGRTAEIAAIGLPESFE